VRKTFWVITLSLVLSVIIVAGLWLDFRVNADYYAHRRVQGAAIQTVTPVESPTPAAGVYLLSATNTQLRRDVAELQNQQAGTAWTVAEQGERLGQIEARVDDQGRQITRQAAETQATLRQQELKTLAAQQSLAQQMQERPPEIYVIGADQNPHLNNLYDAWAEESRTDAAIDRFQVYRSEADRQARYSRPFISGHESNIEAARQRQAYRAQDREIQRNTGPRRTTTSTYVQPYRRSDGAPVRSYYRSTSR